MQLLDFEVVRVWIFTKYFTTWNKLLFNVQDQA